MKFLRKSSEQNFKLKLFKQDPKRPGQQLTQIECSGNFHSVILAYSSHKSPVARLTQTVPNSQTFEIQKQKGLESFKTYLFYYPLKRNVIGRLEKVKSNLI